MPVLESCGQFTYTAHLINKTTGHIVIDMSKREAKKLEILLSGLDVMKRKGYNGTSVKDIVDAAGVPKGSFYNYFESKEGFALDAIDYAAEKNFESCDSVLRSQKPADERVTAFFANGVLKACECDFKVGCFLGNMCQEMADSSDLIRVRLKRVLDRQTEMIKTALMEGGMVESDAAVRAEFLFNSWEGALMRAKSSQSRAPLDAFMAVIPSILAH